MFINKLEIGGTSMNEQQIVGLAVALTALWLFGFGAAMIIGQHGQYVALTGRAGRSIGRTFWRLVGWAWHRWWIQIVWFTLGAGGATYALLR